MALGKPAIQTPNQLEIRTIAGAISNTRQRIEALEGAIASLSGAGISLSSQTQVLLNTLRNTVSQLSAQMAVLTALLSSSNGLVTLVNGVLLTRTLEAGDNITIEFPDGAGGNPVISALGGGDDVLYDDTGRAMLTGDGRAILVSGTGIPSPAPPPAPAP